MNALERVNKERHSYAVRHACQGLRFEHYTYILT